MPKIFFQETVFEDTPQERRGNLAKEGTLVDGEPDQQENGGQERGKREGTKPRPQKRLHCPPGIRTTSQAPALPAGTAALRPAAPAAAVPSASPPAAVPSPRRPAPPPAPVPLTCGAQSPAPASCFGEPRSASQAASFSSSEWLRGRSERRIYWLGSSHGETLWARVCPPRHPLLGEPMPGHTS